ncbi:hypothetical protein MKX01_030632 [Papaver californicum]|nr:hypothetical protein MKX01_030632 [Papaver californicum]
MKLWVFDRNLSALSNCVPMNTQCWDSQKQQKIYQLFSAIFSMSVTRDWL